MSAHDLLPPNSTQLERDLVRSLNAIPRLAPFIQALRLAKVQTRGIPPTVLPWLVLELGLDEISDYHPDLETTLEKGVPWQWIRGTPQAIIDAVGWTGATATLDESDSQGGFYRWSEYQLALDAPVGEAALPQLARAAIISSPARSPLQRIFSFYDARRFVLSGSSLSGGDILSDHSGVRPAELGGFLQVSFGRPYYTFHDHDARALPGLKRLHGYASVEGWRWTLSGTAALSDVYHLPADQQFTTSSLFAIIPFEVDVLGWSAEPWPPARWIGTGERVVMGHQSIT